MSRFLIGDTPRVAIDFDNTIVDSDFPVIHKVKENAVYAIQELKKAGWIIIIWTCREGEAKQEAIDYLNKHEIPYHAINDNPEGYEECGFINSRKVGADIYVDDKNLCHIDSWRLTLNKLLCLYDCNNE
jgi:hypothetical protein